jgi:phosphatidate cytidylyltransferase
MKRLVTALVLIPFFLYIIRWAPDGIFLLVLVAVSVLCFLEYAGIASGHLKTNADLRRNPVPYAAGILMLFVPGQEIAFLCVTAACLMVVSLRSSDLSESLPQSAFLTLGVIYIFGSWRCAAGLRAIHPWWLLFALGLNWVGDSFAYYVGRTFGRHRMSPAISPGKSWEGAIASLAGSIVLGVLFLSRLLPSVPYAWQILLCVVANIAGQIGDLCESAFKRGACLKDSGALLPGHGGWLDRVDSSLFSIPVVYWILQQDWFPR